jgi:hypothetical protein
VIIAKVICIILIPWVPAGVDPDENQGENGRKNGGNGIVIITKE